MFLVNSDRDVVDSFTSNFENLLKVLSGKKDYSLDFLLAVLNLRKDNGLVSFAQENKYLNDTLDINTTILLFVALLKGFKGDKQLYQNEMYLFIDKFKKHYVNECFLTNLNFIWLLSLAGEVNTNFENLCLNCYRKDNLTNEVFHNKSFITSFISIIVNDLADGSFKELLISLLAHRQVSNNLLDLRLTDGCFKVKDKDLFYHFTRPVMISENRYGFDGSALSGSGFNKTTPSLC